jgi:hypothetical protein
MPLRSRQGIDYHECWPELEAGSPPFAIAMKTYSKTLDTTGHVPERFSGKNSFGSSATAAG